MNLKIWILISVLSSSAQARVFNMNSESFAAYLRGTTGAGFENTLNSRSHGDSTDLASDHLYNFSGEFGFIYATPAVNLRFGIELIRPKDVTDEKGKASNGTEYYSMTSELSVMIPKMVIEFNIYQHGVSRFVLGAGIGSANLVARNSYAMTTAGTSNFGIGDFAEDLRSTAILYEGTLGYERLLSDTTTFLVEGGYRSLLFDEIKHNKDVTTFQGAVSKGDRATNMNGDNRELNLTNIYGGLALRFWIN